MAHMLLDGTGAYATMPDAAVLDETGVLDIRAEIDFDAYLGVTQHVVNRWTVGSDRLWQFYLSQKVGTLTFRDSSVDGFFTPQADAEFTLTPGTPTQIRVHIDVATAQEATYYQRAVGTALTVDTGWSQVGSAIATAATNIRTGASIIEFGSNGGGTLSFADGKYYRAVVKKGAGGTLIVDADPSDPATWAGDGLSFTEKANDATVTLQGDAELVGGGSVDQMLLGVG